MTDQIEPDAFADAVAAQGLRAKLHIAAYNAVSYGTVNREWANGALAKLGAPTMQGASEYRINVPVTALFGVTVTATSRAQAKERFAEKLAELARLGNKINDCHRNGFNAYRVTVAEGAEPQFYAGPEDPEDAPEMTLDELKTGIVAFFREAVSLRNWGHSYANETLEDMGLPQLPPMVVKTVQVPVTGTYAVHVRTFEGDTDEDTALRATSSVQQHAAHGAISVKVSEVGDVVPS